MQVMSLARWEDIRGLYGAPSGAGDVAREGRRGESEWGASWATQEDGFGVAARAQGGLSALVMVR
jgi:hypothetical protein